MIHLRKPWTRQPQRPVKVAPKWRGRVIYAAIGGRFIDLTDGTEDVKSFDFVSAPTSAGLMTIDPTTTSGRYIEAVPSESAEFTLVSVIVPQSVTGNQQIVARDESGVRRVFQLRTSGTNVEFIRFNTVPTSFAIALAAGASIGVPLTVVASTAGATARLWAGRKTGSATITGTPQTWITESAGLSRWFERLASGAGAEHGSHRSALRVIIAGGLSEAEGAALAKNPWQLFADSSISIPLAAAAGGAPTISALSARLITATSAQPRISYS